MHLMYYLCLVHPRLVGVCCRRVSNREMPGMPRNILSFLKVEGKLEIPNKKWI